MRINIHAGHNPDGMTACGAIGFLKESTEARAIKERVITLLRARGHEVYDCTCDNGSSQRDVLKRIIAKCNAHEVELDVSIHLNAGAKKTKNGKTTGTEVYVYSKGSAAVPYAKRVCNAVSDLGFTNRGVKVNPNLYVLKHSNAPAMLVECCFVDDPDDADLYNATEMAEAIVYGITGLKVAAVPYLVRTPEKLPVYERADINSKVTMTIKNKGTYTIVKEESGFGKLKSGVGWVLLKSTKKV